MRHDQLFLFWKHARVQHAKQGTIGTSWLELFARFQAIGGQLQCQLVQSSQHVSFTTMLDAFMLKSKAMFAQQGSDDVAELLKPCRTLGASLLQYGVPCHLPSTGIVLCLNLEAAELMHRQLLTLRARSKKGNARQRIGCKFRLPANPPWQHMKFPSLLPDLATANHAKWTEGKDLRFHERALPHPRPEQFFLTCPRPSCGATKDCARCLLHFKTAFKPVKCSSCYSSPASAEWCCPCGHLWHHCPLHRAPGFAAGSGKRSTRAGVRRGAPKALGHTHDVRDGIALRAAIAAADLQASWDSTSLSGPAAAFATAHGLGGHSIDGSQPSHRPPKRAKIPHRTNESSGTKTLSCKALPAVLHPGGPVLHVLPSLPPYIR